MMTMTVELHDELKSEIRMTQEEMQEKIDEMIYGWSEDTCGCCDGLGHKADNCPANAYGLPVY